MVGERPRVELVKVGILPPGMGRALARRLASAAPWEVTLADGPIEPRPAFEAIRQQYSADVLLSHLLESYPVPGLRRLGVTHVDLFVPVFTHLFGYGMLAGRAALVSIFRLRPEFGGDAPDSDLLLDRVTKEALHELGHTFGLVHCPVPWCAMKASSSPEEVDLKDAAYCPSCLRIVEEGGVPREGQSPPCPPRSAG